MCFPGAIAGAFCFGGAAGTPMPAPMIRATPIRCMLSIILPGRGGVPPGTSTNGGVVRNTRHVPDNYSRCHTEMTPFVRFLYKERVNAQPEFPFKYCVE